MRNAKKRPVRRRRGVKGRLVTAVRGSAFEVLAWKNQRPRNRNLLTSRKSVHPIPIVLSLDPPLVLYFAEFKGCNQPDLGLCVGCGWDRQVPKLVVEVLGDVDEEEGGAFVECL